VLAAAEKTDVPFEVVACDPSLADTAQFCEHYGFSLMRLNIVGLDNLSCP
jgi:hypothetical protein